MHVRTGPLLALALVVTLVGVSVGWPRDAGQASGGGVLAGRVVDELGQAVPGATVQVADGEAVRSDARGRFRAATTAGPRLINATAAGHLSRTLAAEPGAPVEIILTGRAAETLALRFGGDVMFGRRFYDVNDDGDPSDGLLPTGASAARHAALLSQVKPLLADADLSVVNLETPLMADPWRDPKAKRPARFHPTKEFVFASSPESVRALLDSGVDAVSLGNNHVFDGLAPGLDSTLSALDRAGMPHFGAGRTVDEAWAPAVVERKGQQVAFIGCTTITGTEHQISYVVGASHGGAASCAQARLRQEVQAARARSDVVVVMVHGGEEYRSRQTEVVQELSRTARQAGAALVVNGHPHVVGGVTVEGQTVVAETMGNLLFDQTVWPSFLSYLLRVDVRAGAPVLGTVDPLLIENFVPRPTVGSLADSASRRAAGMLPGPMRLRPAGAAFTTARADARGGDDLRSAPGRCSGYDRDGGWTSSPRPRSGSVRTCCGPARSKTWTPTRRPPERICGPSAGTSRTRPAPPVREQPGWSCAAARSARRTSC